MQRHYSVCLLYTSHTQIYSLADSYSIILSKLANMTPEKHRRYATVYAKLRDFEGFLASRGIPADMAVQEPLPVSPKAPALCTGEEAISGLRHLTFDNSLRLMDTFSADAVSYTHLKTCVNLAESLAFVISAWYLPPFLP